MKLHHLGKVRQKVCDAVIASVGVVLVLNVLLGELAIERGSAFFESIVVVLATVEVNGKAAQRRRTSLGQPERIIGIPMGGVDRSAEYRCEHSQQRGARVCCRIQLLGGFRNEGGTLRADSRKHLWMRKCES